MKKHLLFITLLLTLKILNGQTNVYHSFPDSANWRIDVIINQPQGDCQAIYYFQYYTSGDTLINSYNYKKIYKSYVYLTSTGSASPCDPLPQWDYSGYIGALRDDSLSNKTFFVYQNNNNDSLIYDYNLNVGDTIIGNSSIDNIQTVTSVDSILIGSQFRKRWNYAYGYIIQGIGSSTGLIEFLDWGPSSPDHTYLICVKDSSTTLFTSGDNSAMGCNLIYYGLNEINAKNNFNCYPNPATSQTTITYTQLNAERELFLYNMLGQIVYEEKLTKGSLQTKLNIRNYKAGLYKLILKEKGIIKVQVSLVKN